MVKFALIKVKLITEFFDFIAPVLLGQIGGYMVYCLVEKFKQLSFTGFTIVFDLNSKPVGCFEIGSLRCAFYTFDEMLIKVFAAYFFKAECVLSIFEPLYFTEIKDMLVNTIIYADCFLCMNSRANDKQEDCCE